MTDTTTNEQTARAIGEYFFRYDAILCEALVEQIAAALAANTERCAKVAEGCWSATKDNTVWACAQTAIAAAIRKEGV